MKQKQSKKALTLLVCLVVLLAITVGGTLAYLMASTPTVKNEFTPANVSCQVVETFVNSTKTNVKIRNIGNTNAYIRAAVVVTWKNDKGEVYAATPQKDTDYKIDWNLSNDGWVKGNNGFYYYTKAVPPYTHTGEQEHTGCMTGVLINSCSPIDGKAPDGYFLSVEIVASAIQSTPDGVVGGEWSNSKVTVSGSNGTLTVENMQGD